MFYNVRVTWVDSSGSAICAGMDKEFILESDRDLATVNEEVSAD